MRLGIAHLLHVYPRTQLLPQPRRQKGGKLLSLPLRVAAHQRQLGQGRVCDESGRALRRPLRRTDLLLALRQPGLRLQQLRLDAGLRQMVCRHAKPHGSALPLPPRREHQGGTRGGEELAVEPQRRHGLPQRRHRGHRRGQRPDCGHDSLYRRQHRREGGRKELCEEMGHDGGPRPHNRGLRRPHRV